MNFQYFGGGSGHDEQPRARTSLGSRSWPTSRPRAARAAAGCDRSLGPTMVNEVPYRLRRRAGRSSRRTSSRRSMWAGSVANQGGFYLNISRAMGFTTDVQNYMNAGRCRDHLGARRVPSIRSRTPSTGRRVRTASTSAATFTQYQLWTGEPAGRAGAALRRRHRAIRRRRCSRRRELPGRVGDRHRPAREGSTRF